MAKKQSTQQQTAMKDVHYDLVGVLSHAGRTERRALRTVASPSVAPLASY